MSTRTRWTVELERIAGVRQIKLQVDSDDPHVVELIEQAADRAGVELLRELADEHEQELEA